MNCSSCQAFKLPRFRIPARLFETLRVQTVKDLLGRILNDGRVHAMLTRLEVGNVSFAYFLVLTIADHFAEHVGLENLADDLHRELELAPGDPALEVVLGVADQRDNELLDALPFQETNMLPAVLVTVFFSRLDFAYLQNW